jgi:hypothetical protein
LTRDDLKKRFLADVVAKRKANRHGDEYRSNVEDTFRRLFPTVYQFIRDINRDGWEHATLIRRLQQEESKLVIETVAADLVVRHPEVFVLTCMTLYSPRQAASPLWSGRLKRRLNGWTSRWT